MRSSWHGSWYETSVARPAWPAQAGEARADLCVVGGGLTGLTAALELAERGISVRLLEAGRIGGGASGLNGGHVHLGYHTPLSVLERTEGKAVAEALAMQAVEALALVDDRIARHSIDCARVHGYLNLASAPGQRASLDDTAEDLARMGVDVVALDREALRQHVSGPLYSAGLRDETNGHLNPLKYALGLAKAAQAAGATLHEDSRVLGIDGRPGALTLRTDGGVLQAEQAILATDAFPQDFVPALATRCLAVDTYLLATDPLPEETQRAMLPDPAAMADSALAVTYFRLAEDGRLIFGGDDAPSAPTLRRLMLRHLPGLADVPVRYFWSGRVGISLRRLPVLGRDPRGIWYAAGYSGLGLALTGLAGRALAEAVAGETARFDRFAALRHPELPGGRWLRAPLAWAGLTLARLRDRL